MNDQTRKLAQRLRRKRHVRHRVFGTSERPRLTVFRSNQHISAQIIDDSRGVTLCQASSQNKAMAEAVKYGGNKAAADQVGTALASAAKAKGIEKVAFDRNGYRFHGRVQALADAARKAGLLF
ncbi:MAG: 50S ribosomal protein L18 [Phycisphaerales bacterium]|nr:50S ribosomal protein L18 [Phycisphaerales bacterium]